MTLIKWSPVRELLTIQDSMNKLLEDTFGGTKQMSNFVDKGFEPLIDVFEDNDKIEVSAELPGMDQKDVKINIEGNVLNINGEKKFENDEKRDNYHRVERYYGSFSRTFTLPGSVDQEKIKANFKNGVLKISLPKKEEVKPKQISIDIK